MSYKVSATDLKAIQFNEKNELNAVLQNIAVILSTPMGTVPLNRDFGVDWSFLDKPAPVAKALMVAPVREAIERWEPRAAVLGVSFSEDLARPGVLIPIVEVDISLA
ncbi:hypothetical protein D1159_16080 [Pseudoflavonifractor sp. 524-17]|uniref:GPW/gp25 family protein n=1 Tax=Pseudoflavonifractor sp. 524-17 TaxID=2304577 RepID=UPI00137B10DB|nr:GPW/gp25 family protein [Pseudoflavonifractor sp. 524-17]NCE66055.1 hypothetical protein [Pseudoflavonifractor sp. 524-17]